MNKYLIVILALLSSSAWAVNGRDGNLAASATSGTFTATATNDLKIVFAIANGTVTIPSPPGSGWTTIDSGATTAGTAMAFRIGCNKSSSSGDTGSGTWTGATLLVGASYSGTAVLATGNCNFTGIGGFAKNNAKASTTLNYPATCCAHSQVDGSSWFAGFAGSSAGAVCTPTGMTQVVPVGTVPAAAVADTNAGAASWASTNCTVTSGTWMSESLEIMVATCQSTSYIGNLTCAQATPLVSPGACGLQNSAVTPLFATNSILLVFVDANAAATAVSDQVDGSWTNVVADTNWQGTSHTSFWKKVPTSTAARNVTFTCAGSTSFEYVFVEIHSTVGTPVVDCISSIIQGTQTNPAPGCTSTKVNELGVSFIDWNNQPTAGSTWKAIAEQEENIMELKGLASATAFTAPWTISDTLMTVAMAVGDGATAAAPAGQFPRVN